MRKTGIMQPYFLPYIGYFQLISSVNEFVIYDNIKYTKKGWINRNRILCNDTDHLIGLPIKNDSDFLNINQRQLADNFHSHSKFLLNKFKECYRKAPHYNDIYPVLEIIFACKQNNLFEFLNNSIKILVDFLEIKTKLLVSSNINIDHNLKSQDKVIAICQATNANFYINAIGGVDLYNKQTFKENGIILNFIKSQDITYKQYENKFVPWLSIIDVLMFNKLSDVKSFLNRYDLI